MIEILQLSQQGKTVDPIREEMMVHIQEEREEHLNLQINALNAKELVIGKFYLSFLYVIHLNIKLVMRDGDGDEDGGTFGKGIYFYRNF